MGFFERFDKRCGNCELLTSVKFSKNEGSGAIGFHYGFFFLSCFDSE